MNKCTVALLIGFVSLLVSTTAPAVIVTHLYQADLPVMSQSEDERAQAVRQGFAEMMIKLTGDQAIAKNPAIKEAIQRADYYISEFSYSLPSPQSATYFLHVRFEPADVHRLLHKAGVTYWGEKRPLILVWLAVTNSKQETDIIGIETTGELLDSLKHRGKQLALPLIFPLMDVTDMSHVSSEEILNLSLPALETAGKRYSPNAYLVGQIKPTLEGFQSEWELILNHNHWKFSISGKSLDEVVIALLDQTSQTLVKYYGIRS